MMWWSEGIRVEKKIFNIQSGLYGLSFDYSQLQLRKLGMLPEIRTEREAFVSGNTYVEALPDVRMEALLLQDNRTYKAEGSGDLYDCQLVESGTFFQRRWMVNLRFQGFDPDFDAMDSGLQIAAWHDRVIFTLRLKSTTGITGTGLAFRFLLPEGYIPDPQTVGMLRYTSSDGQILAFQYPEHVKTDTQGQSVVFFAQPAHWPTGRIENLEIVVYPTARGKVATSPAETGVAINAIQTYPRKKRLRAAFDSGCGWYHLALSDDINTMDQSKPETPPEERVDVVVENRTSVAQQVDFCFSHRNNIGGITGIQGIVCDQEGIPTGLPVQISKNWHGKPGRFNGQWYHGITTLLVPAKSTAKFVYRGITAFWRNVPAVSMAQLCLVGWGKNQLWLQSAIGSWGEHLTFEPDQTHGRGMVLDSRPLMVTGMRGTRWNWTHNVGGFDFLVYHDTNDIKRWPANVKTLIRRYGPNLAEVSLSFTTDDDKIEGLLSYMIYAVDDYVRGIYGFQFRVREDVSFSRLAFFQLGSDAYNYSAEKKLAWGNTDGLVKEWPASWGGNVYRTDAVPLTGHIPWVSMHEAEKLRPEEGAWANRGLVIRRWEAQVMGRQVDPWMAERGAHVTGNDTSQIDILPPAGTSRLKAGDYAWGVVEHLILPQYGKDYYGPNARLKTDLNNHQNTWWMVWREAVGNDLHIAAEGGEVVQSIPICIRCLSTEVDLFLRGGIGVMAVTFTGIQQNGHYMLREKQESGWYTMLDTNRDRAGWQVDFNAAEGTWEVTLTINLDKGTAATRGRRFKFIAREN
jgi:hypothetical protein